MLKEYKEWPSWFPTRDGNNLQHMQINNGNRMKDRNHMIISIDMEKAFEISKFSTCQESMCQEKS